MANYVLLYSGGSDMPETEEAQAAVMAAWGAWMGSLGAKLADGGNPMSGNSRTISADGSVSDGGLFAVTGYGIITADSMDEALELAKGCPIRDGGGSISVYETFEIQM